MFNEKWNTMVKLYGKLGKKGMLVLAGVSPNVELYYFDYEMVSLMEGDSAEEVVDRFLAQLNEEAKLRIAKIREEADSKIANLAGVG